MKKTIDINLGGMLFHLDEDAYQRVGAYLDAVRAQLKHVEGCEEIIADIEARLAELFHAHLSPGKQVISLSEVDAAIRTLGQPEDFGDGESQPTAETTQPHGEAYEKRIRRLYRDVENGFVGGVCGGLAAYFRVDPVIFRVLFLLLLFSGAGPIAYFILWAAIPGARTTAEKLAMRGEDITLDNIKKSVEEEAQRMKARFQAGAEEVSPAVKRAASGLGGATRNIVEAIGGLVAIVFRVIGFFLLLGIAAAGIALIVVATNGFSFESDWTQGTPIFAMAMTVLPSSMSMSVLWLATIAAVLGIVIEITALVLRYTFRVEIPRASWRWIHGTAILSSLVGVIIWVVMGIQMGLEFREEARHIEAIPLAEGRTEWALTVAPNALNIPDNHVSLGEFLDGLELYYDGIALDVKQSMRQVPSLECVVESRGSNRREARLKADRVQYDVTLEGNSIVLGDLISFPLDDRFRGQNARFTLYLPVGHSVYLDESCSDYLDDVDNLQNMYDPRMAGKLWMMTEEGLTLYAESRL